MQAFKKSQRIDLAKRVLDELAANAVAECRFKDAAYYFWMLSKETEQEQQQRAAKTAATSEGPEGPGSAVALKKEKEWMQQQAQLQFEYELKADLYFAYASVHAYVTDPFTSLQPEMLFQVARFIVNSLGNSETIPLGISKANTLFTLAKQAMHLGAYKLARHAYDRLSKLQISRKQEEVELDMLLVQAKPVRDDPDHLPVCYRCGSANPLLNPFTNKFAKGDVCTNCGHPFVRSFINFDILPLVEFVPDPSITDEEAIELIRQPPPAAGGRAAPFGAGATRGKAGGKGAAGGWKESKSAAGETLSFDGGGDRGEGKHMDEADALHEALGVNAGETDLFTRCLNLTLEKQVSA
jgi:intraflagellar transport protein 122